MDRRTLNAHLAVIAMLGLTVIALIFGVDVHLEDQAGVRMQMPRQVGAWSGTQLLFCHADGCRWQGHDRDVVGGAACPQCGASLFAMALVEKEQLPGDTQFLKYLYTSHTGEELTAFIVLSGNARNSIHRPQRCLVAQGYAIIHSQVTAIPVGDRPPLNVMVLNTLYHFQPRQGVSRELPVSYAYWFVGQNRETPKHLTRMFWLAWDRIFHGVAHRWVYIIIQGKADQPADSFVKSLHDFIPEWYPTVLR